MTDVITLLKTSEIEDMKEIVRLMGLFITTNCNQTRIGLENGIKTMEMRSLITVYYMRIALNGSVSSDIRQFSLIRLRDILKSGMNNLGEGVIKTIRNGIVSLLKMITFRNTRLMNIVESLLVLFLDFSGECDVDKMFDEVVSLKIESEVGSFGYIVACKVFCDYFSRNEVEQIRTITTQAISILKNSNNHVLIRCLAFELLENVFKTVQTDKELARVFMKFYGKEIVHEVIPMFLVGQRTFLKGTHRFDYQIAFCRMFKRFLEDSFVVHVPNEIVRPGMLRLVLDYVSCIGNVVIMKLLMRNESQVLMDWKARRVDARKLCVKFIRLLNHIIESDHFKSHFTWDGSGRSFVLPLFRSIEVCLYQKQDERNLWMKGFVEKIASKYKDEEVSKIRFYACVAIQTICEDSKSTRREMFRFLMAEIGKCSNKKNDYEFNWRSVRVCVRVDMLLLCILKIVVFLEDDFATQSARLLLGLLFKISSGNGCPQAIIHKKVLLLRAICEILCADGEVPTAMINLLMKEIVMPQNKSTIKYTAANVITEILENSPKEWTCSIEIINQLVTLHMIMIQYCSSDNVWNTRSCLEMDELLSNLMKNTILLVRYKCMRYMNRSFSPSQVQFMTETLVKVLSRARERQENDLVFEALLVMRLLFRNTDFSQYVQQQLAPRFIRTIDNIMRSRVQTGAFDEFGLRMSIGLLTSIVSSCERSKDFVVQRTFTGIVKILFLILKDPSHEQIPSKCLRYLSAAIFRCPNVVRDLMMGQNLSVCIHLIDTIVIPNIHRHNFADEFASLIGVIFRSFYAILGTERIQRIFGVLLDLLRNRIDYDKYMAESQSFLMVFLRILATSSCYSKEFMNIMMMYLCTVNVQTIEWKLRSSQSRRVPMETSTDEEEEEEQDGLSYIIGIWLGRMHDISGFVETRISLYALIILSLNQDKRIQEMMIGSEAIGDTDDQELRFGVLVVYKLLQHYVHEEVTTTEREEIKFDSMSAIRIHNDKRFIALDVSKDIENAIRMLVNRMNQKERIVLNTLLVKKGVQNFFVYLMKRE